MKQRFHRGPVIQIQHPNNAVSEPDPNTLGVFRCASATVFITVRNGLRVIRIYSRVPIESVTGAAIKAVLQASALHGREPQLDQHHGFCSHIAPLAARATARQICDLLEASNKSRSPKHSVENTEPIGRDSLILGPLRVRARRGSSRKRSSTEHAVSAANPRPGIT